MNKKSILTTGIHFWLFFFDEGVITGRVRGFYDNGGQVLMNQYK